MRKSNIMLAVLLGVLFALPSFAGSSSYTIEDALKKNLITATFTGRKHATNSYYGGCLELMVKNISGHSISLRLENGRRLNCIYDSVQNMLVTQAEVLALLPAESKEMTIYAMCSQKHHYSPGAGTSYHLGAMAEDQIVQLTMLIEKYKAQNHTGQQAVWVLTDNDDPSSIYGEDKEVVKVLRDYVSNAPKHKKQAARQPGFIYDYSYPQQDDNSFTVEGDLYFQVLYKSFVSLYLYDNDGNRVKVIFQDVPYSTGLQNYHYKVTSGDFRPGELYWLRMKTDNAVIKELAIQMD